MQGIPVPGPTPGQAGWPDLPQLFGKPFEGMPSSHGNTKATGFARVATLAARKSITCEAAWRGSARRSSASPGETATPRRTAWRQSALALCERVSGWEHQRPSRHVSHEGESL